jgi:nucleoside-diphosphate-sugar epimerase
VLEGLARIMRCLVTGASGAVGPALVNHLLASEHAVRILSRRPDDRAWDTRVQVVRADIGERDAMDRALDQIDVVFHLAALLHVVNPPPALRQEYERVNIGGTRNVIERSAASGVARVVFFSTIAVYGTTGGQLIDEGHPAQPDSFYGETKLEAERLVLSARAGSSPLGTVLRLAAVYGPGLKGNYLRLVKALARRRFVQVGAGDNRRTLIFDSDVARAAASCATSSGAAGKVYNVTDGRPHAMRDIVAAICAALGRTPPRFHVPVTPMRVAATVMDAVARTTHARLPFGSSTIDKYLEDVAVSGERLQTDLNWEPRMTLTTGWRETIGGLRRAGDL